MINQSTVQVNGGLPFSSDTGQMFLGASFDWAGSASRRAAEIAREEMLVGACLSKGAYFTKKKRYNTDFSFNYLQMMKRIRKTEALERWRDAERYHFLDSQDFHAFRCGKEVDIYAEKYQGYRFRQKLVRPKMAVTGNILHLKLENQYQIRGKHGGIRGEITEWSKASRRRMLYYFNEIEVTTRKDLINYEITLTYPFLFGYDGKKIKRDLDYFHKYMCRKYKTEIMMIWKLEFQRRGAPHFHIMALSKKRLEYDYTCDYDVICKTNNDCIYKRFIKDVADIWIDIVTDSYQGLDKQKIIYSMQAFNYSVGKYKIIRPVENEKGFISYLYKYIAKEEKYKSHKNYDCCEACYPHQGKVIFTKKIDVVKSQLTVPEGYINVGQFWGVKGRFIKKRCYCRYLNYAEYVEVLKAIREKMKEEMEGKNKDLNNNLSLVWITDSHHKPIDILLDSTEMMMNRWLELENLKKLE